MDLVDVVDNDEWHDGTVQPAPGRVDEAIEVELPAIGNCRQCVEDYGVVYCCKVRFIDDRKAEPVRVLAKEFAQFNQAAIARKSFKQIPCDD